MEKWQSLSKDEKIDSLHKEIDRLTNELSDFKTDYAAVINKHRRAIIDIQRLVSKLYIDSYGLKFKEDINDLLGNRPYYELQVERDMDKAKSSIGKSNNPYLIVNKFKEYWTNYLKDAQKEGS
jgi:hypothetical protein